MPEKKLLKAAIKIRIILFCLIYLGFIQSAVADHFAVTSGPALTNMTVHGSATIDGQSLQDQIDEIAIVNSRAIICGFCKISSDSTYLITVKGDVLTGEGAAKDENLSFVIWDDSEQREISVTSSMISSPITFTPDNSIEVTITATTTGLPTIEKIAPNRTIGIGMINISGANFYTGTTVTIAGIPSEAVYYSSTKISVSVPMHEIGTVNVMLTNPNGQTAIVPNGLTYVELPCSCPVPDSGQTKCYDNNSEIPCPKPGEPFYGQAGNYTINEMSFTKMDNKGNDLPDDAEDWVMVRDNVTGLIWEIKQAKDGIADYENPNDADNKYSWYDTNPANNLGYTGDYNDGKNTQDFIEQLNQKQLGGFNDWRMPSPKELASIANLAKFRPAIDVNFFPNTVSDLLSAFYWSSTSDANYTDLAWGVDFRHGLDSGHDKDSSYYVRAVRGGQCWSFDNLVINGDRTITDIASGMMWELKTENTWHTWKNAMDYCENASTAMYTDWRLPEQKEIRTIVNFTRYLPAMNIDFFHDTMSAFYWSSASHAYGTRYAWGVDFNHGNVYNDAKDSSYYVRAVRGGQSRSFGNLFIWSPKQASFWQPGNTMSIEWETQNIPGNVKISLSTDGGRSGTYETIAVTENDGAYDWQVTGDISVNCMLKIEPVDEPDKGTRQGLFTIHTYSNQKYQTVALFPANTILSDHSAFTLTANYSTSDNGKANGIGVRFHFDSSLVSLTSLENVFLTPAILNPNPTEDTNNFDNDVTTDQYVELSWTSLSSDWPDSTQPVKLADLNFLGVSTGQTSINTSLFDVADGYTGKAFHASLTIESNAKIDIQTITQRIDGSGILDIVFTGTSPQEQSVNFLPENCIYSTSNDFSTYTPLSFQTSDSEHTAYSPLIFSPDGNQYTAVVDASSWLSGNYYIQLGIDANVSAVSNQLTIDNLPPDSPMISTNEDKNIATIENILQLTGTCSLDTEYILINDTIQGIAYTKGSAEWSFIGELQTGDNIIVVESLDSLGNHSNPYTLTVKYIPPFKPFTCPVPDSGQTVCSDNNGNQITCPAPGAAYYGQDGSYRINEMSFTKLDEFGNDLPDDAPNWLMVRDNVTGLIWEIKQAYDGVANYDNPNDADNTYTWYKTIPGEDALIAYFPFDENANDTTGNGYDGIVYGNMVYETGLVNQAAIFDGIDDYIQLSKTLDTNEIKAISVFINSKGTDGNNNNGIIIGKYNWTGKRDFLVTSFGRNNENFNYIGVTFHNNPDGGASDSIASFYNDTNILDINKYVVINNQQIATNTWEHIVVNITSTEIEIWVNGQISNKVKRDYNLYHNADTETYIGNLLAADQGSNNRFIGAMDDLRIFNRPLTEPEIQALYQKRIFPGEFNDGKNTESYIHQLNEKRFGGFNDWRLPSAHELSSFPNCGKEYPAVETDYFQDIVADMYWTDTNLSSTVNYAWVVHFDHGWCDYKSKGSLYHVRAVRGRQNLLSDHFVNNGDETVTDIATGLMWQLETPDTKQNWGNALASCENLSLAQFNDWRLPAPKEIRSIIDFRYFQPAIDSKYFPDTMSEHYCTSASSIKHDYQRPWLMATSSGGDTNSMKTTANYYRAVRGGQNRLTDHLFIKSPKQGSIWKPGDIMPIVWETNNISGNVNLSLSREGGRDNSFESIIETENVGYYEWTVSGNISVNCILKIEPLADPDKSTQQGLFSIYPDSIEKFQHVRLHSSTMTAELNKPITITANYSTSDIAKTRGVGLRFHYDSSKLMFMGFQSVSLTPSVIDQTSLDDIANDDNDFSTDKYVTLNWSSPKMDWPENVMALKLADLNFTTQSFGPGNINISFLELSNEYIGKAENVSIIVEQSANTQPIISLIEDQSIDEDSTGFISFTVTDAESAPCDLTLSMKSSDQSILPDNNISCVCFENNYTITALPETNQNGIIVLSLIVSDHEGLTASTSVQLTVNSVNDPPVIIGIEEQSITEGSSFADISLDEIVDDVDDLNSELSWTATGQSDLQILIVNHIASIEIPYFGWTGTETILFTATDPEGLTASYSVDLTVNLGEFAYWTEPGSDMHIKTLSIEGESKTLRFKANVPSGKTLKAYKFIIEYDSEKVSVVAKTSQDETFQPANVNTATPGMIIFNGFDVSGITGLAAIEFIDVTFTAIQQGSLDIITNVQNFGSSSSDQFLPTPEVLHINVTQTQPDLPTISEIDDQTLKLNIPCKLSYTITDADPNNLTVSATSSNLTLVSIENIALHGQDAFRSISITPTVNMSGTAMITLAVTDGYITVTSTFELTILPNDPPDIPSIQTPENNQKEVAQQPLLSWTCSDPNPGDILIYDVYLSTSESLTTCIASGLTQTQLKLTNDLNLYEYYHWKVIVTDNYGATQTGPVWTFQTDDQPDIFFDQDLSPYTVNDCPRIDFPKSLAAQNNMLKNMINVKMVDFENFDEGSINSLSLDFGKGGNTTINLATGLIVIVENPNETLDGMFPVSGTKFLESKSTVNIVFEKEMSAFGFYVTDFENNSTDVIFTHANGDQQTFQIPYTLQNSGSISFWGIIFKAFTFKNITIKGSDDNDFLGFDDFIAIEKSQLSSENLPPEDPSQNTPENNTENIELIPTLTWSCTDPNPLDTLTYTLYLNTSNSFTTPLTSNLSQMSYTVQSPLLSDTTYYWRIDATDQNGITTQGPTWKFKTIYDKITIFVSSYPKNAGSIQINGANEPLPCSLVVDSGTLVTLVPISEENYTLAIWQSNIFLSDNIPLTFTAYQNTNITAVFNRPPVKPVLTETNFVASASGTSVTPNISNFEDEDEDDIKNTYIKLWLKDQYKEDLTLSNPLIQILSGSSFDLTQTGLKYHYQVGYQDTGSEKTTWSDDDSFITGIANNEPSLTILPGTEITEYEMVSFTKWPSNPSATGIFEYLGVYEDDFRMGTYDPEMGNYIEYPDGLNIVPGRAYWVLIREGRELSFDGVSVSTGVDFDVPLKFSSDDGWNMIACPNDATYQWTNLQVLLYTDTGHLDQSYKVAELDTLSETELPVENRICKWNKSETDPYTYYDELQLEPNEGYWVKALKPNVYLRFPKDNRTRSMRKTDNKRQVNYYDDAPPMPMSDSVIEVYESAPGGCFVENIFDGFGVLDLLFFLGLLVIIITCHISIRKPDSSNEE
jgi:hypothetical protein